MQTRMLRRLRQQAARPATCEQGAALLCHSGWWKRWRLAGQWTSTSHAATECGLETTFAQTPGCTFYYKLGLSLAGLLADQRLAAMLLKAFSERCWPAVDVAVYGSAMERGTEVMRERDAMERDIFFASREMAIAVNRYKERHANKIYEPDCPQKDISVTCTAA
jgi:hypothetical protein